MDLNVSSHPGGLDRVALIVCDGEFRYLAGNAAANRLLENLEQGTDLADAGWRTTGEWRPVHELSDGGTTRVVIGQAEYQVRLQILDDGHVCLLLEPLQLSEDIELSQAVSWLEAIDESVLLLDDSGTVVFANPRAEREHGHEVGGMVGLHLADIHSERPGAQGLSEDRGELVRALRSILAQGGPRRYQALHRRSDGSRFPVTVLLRARRVGQRELLLGLVRDEATEQGRIDELQRSLAAMETAGRAKSRVVSSAGHDLRTPLTAILGFCDLLLLDYDDTGSEPGRSLERIQRSAHILDRQFTRMIEFFKLEDGRLEVDYEDVPPSRIVRETCDRWCDEAARAEVTLRQHIDDSVDRVAVRSDERRIHAALDELVANALRFGAGGTVELKALRYADEVRIEIHDQGPGIPPYLREHLFEAFTDQGELRFREGTGIGIGLHMAGRLAELVGARLECMDAEGSGAALALVLPLR